MTDESNESNCDTKETKQGLGRVTGGMGYYSRCCKKLEEGFRRDEGFAREISTAR